MWRTRVDKWGLFQHWEECPEMVNRVIQSKPANSILMVLWKLVQLLKNWINEHQPKKQLVTDQWDCILFSEKNKIILAASFLTNALQKQNFQIALLAPSNIARFTITMSSVADAPTGYGCGGGGGRSSTALSFLLLLLSSSNYWTSIATSSPFKLTLQVWGNNSSYESLRCTSSARNIVHAEPNVSCYTMMQLHNMWVVLGKVIVPEKKCLFRKNGKTTKNKLCVYSFSCNLSAQSECYQLLHFLHRTLFRDPLENEPMGLCCIVFCSFGRLLPRWAHLSIMNRWAAPNNPTTNKTTKRMLRMLPLTQYTWAQKIMKAHSHMMPPGRVHGRHRPLAATPYVFLSCSPCMLRKYWHDWAQ